MRFSIEALFAASFLIPAVAARGFHLFDRQMVYRVSEAEHCIGQGTACVGKYWVNVQDLMFIPSNQYNCDAIRNKWFRTNKQGSWEIGHGTWIPGQCGSKGLVLYPVKNGQELEVWESGGSRKYGNCYRQRHGAQLSCDDKSEVACRSAGQGEPGGNGCKVTATDVWVCGMDLC